MIYAQELLNHLVGVKGELAHGPYEASLDGVLAYLQQRVDLTQEDPRLYRPASRVLDIMVARMEDGQVNLSGLGAFRTLLGQLEARAMDMEFPCPICLATGKFTVEDCPKLTLSFDEEPGDYGTVLSSWPVLHGRCEDPRLPTGFPHHGYHREVRNHGDRINSRCEDGELSSEMERVLGAYVERKRLAEYLGVAHGR